MRFVIPAVWAVVVVTTTWCVLGPLPEWIAGADLARMPVEQRFGVLSSIRGQCVQTAVALTSILTAGYAVRKYFLDRDAQRAQLDKNMTDRFNAAVDHLGSEDETVRAGGVRALHRIMTDSPRDHDWVVDTITGFVRNRTTTTDSTTTVTAGAHLDGSDDVHAAIIGLRFRPDRPEREPLNLSGAQLPNANLRGIRLIAVDLTRADLDGAELSHADLTRGRLSRATLRSADLTRARLDNADLREADLRRATLSGAALTNAQLGETKLEAADLSDVDLTGADLRRAELGDATLTRTLLHDADISYADLRGVDLRETTGLTRDALHTAITDDDTRLPSELRENAPSMQQPPQRT